MPIPLNVLANADDFGYNTPVNEAILYCYKQQYINSSSLLTNTAGFDEAVNMIREHTCINNVGVHINFAEGAPLTNVGPAFLTAGGTWNHGITSRTLARYSAAQKQTLYTEISAQIDKALLSGVPVSHIDTHYHLHTLPAFYPLFLQAAKQYKLKLRLAQTYREGSYLKYWYRLFINKRLTDAGLNYSDKFETVDYFAAHFAGNKSATVTEVMLHPGYDDSGVLTDHYDSATMQKWISLCQTTAE